jgi:3-oxoacyl-[acyl-carrier-protein] synthase II
MASRRVAVTGLGILSCAGRGKDAFWGSLLERRTGISPISSFSTEGLRSRLGGEIKDVKARSAKAYAAEAVRGALADAGLGPSRTAPERAGLALGTTQGEWLPIEAALDRRARGGSEAALRQEAFPEFPGSIPAAVARELGWRGPCIALTSACAAGNFALAYAYEKIVQGQADLMAAGGVDVLSQTNYIGFNRLLALAPEVCAPFSKGRKGMLPAEGCAVLILEELEAARRRGARIYAELLGCGMSSDGHHVTAPAADGVARALEDCLRRSGLEPGEVDYINAHGTGTPVNDKTETAAIKRVFGERAGRVPVSSIKALLGHAMGAASALEAAACCLALETGVLPPTANFTAGDPDCDLDYVPEGPRRTSPRVVLNNGFAFGGSNAVIALAAPGFADGRMPVSRPIPWPPLAVTGLALVEDPDPLALAERLLPDKDLGFFDRAMAYALCGASEALRDAGLDFARCGDRLGVVLDTSGELENQLRYRRDFLSQGPSGIEPLLFPGILANAAASRTSVLLGLKLLNESIAGSFPGGESAVACACDFLSRRGAGALLAGGVWAAGEGDPAGLPEGAAVLVLESLAEAQARRARIHAVVRTWRESFDPARPPAPTSSRLLVEAVRRVSAEAVPVELEARGFWGGVIRLRLEPAP